MKTLLRAGGLLLLLSTINFGVSTSHAQSTAFTYQGRLNDGAAPANGSYDVAFSLYATNAGGAIVAGPVTNPAVAVSNGLFTTAVDFGNVFTGADRWLELAVSTNGANAFSTLSPRQALSPVPAALYARSASNVLGQVNASQLSGSIPATNLSGTVSLAQLPANVITNGASGVNFSGNFGGTFTGNGAGVTNVDVNTLLQKVGTVIGWGRNNFGQTNIPVGLSDVANISAGLFHCLALRFDETVIGWGNNNFGQISIPPGLSNVVAIAGGAYHSLALKSDGTVVAWGGNADGQISIPPGLSNVVAIAGGASHSLVLKGNGTVIAWGYNALGQTNVPFGLSNVVAIAAGGYHNLALKSDGRLVAWGRNFEGQTNIPVGLSNVVAIAGGAYHSIALKSDGTVIAWGYNNEGETNTPVGLSNVMAIAGAPFGTLALKSNGTVIAWGDNSWGQTDVPFGLSNVVAIAGGTDYTLALQKRVIPAQIALLTGNNVFQGSITAAGFSGDGSGLTNLNAAAVTSGTLSLSQMPISVVTNGASGVNITGTFSGNGAGITGVDLRTANSFGAFSFTTNYGTFTLASSPGGVGVPVSVTSADVNGDGRPDLISANWYDYTLTVLTNNGSGGFVISSSPGVGSGPRSVTSADVNGDGRPDLISGNYNANTLTVLTNNGSGGFVISSAPGVGSHPLSVTSADVNGDGRPDLISANEVANTLTVLTNNGSGGFVISSSPGVGSSSPIPHSVTSADVNGDGRPDLISANYNTWTLTVLTNNGSGGFVISSSPGVGANPASVTTADVNGDGRPDLISANAGAITLTVLTNNGSGGFVISSSPGVGSGPLSVTSADVNGDGRPDLISANQVANTLTVLTNNGSGGFVISSSLGVGSGPESVTTADVNGDGRPDLISANGGANTLTVLFNTGTILGNFTGNGSGLTSLNATNVIGTLGSAQIPNLDASKITTGTLADARLSSNVALLNANQTFTGTNTFSGTFVGSAPYLKFWEVRPSGVDGGTNNAGTNNFRNFTKSIDTHTLGSTNASGDIVLPAGTYQCRISAAGYRVNSHQARLRTSAGTVLLYGTSEYSNSALNPGVQSRSLIEGQFTLNSTTTNQVQHYMESLKDATGLGVALPANAWSDTNALEVYAVAEFWKIK